MEDALTFGKKEFMTLCIVASIITVCVMFFPAVLPDVFVGVAYVDGLSVMLFLEQSHI